MFNELLLEMANVPPSIVYSSIKSHVHLDDRHMNKHITKFNLPLWLQGNIRDATMKSKMQIIKVNFKWGEKRDSAQVRQLLLPGSAGWHQIAEITT